MPDAALLDSSETGRLLALPVEKLRGLVRSGALTATIGPQGEARFRSEDVRQLACRCTSETHHHAVQFFDDEGFLANVVGAFLAEGLHSRAPMVVIARPRRRELFLRCLDDLGCRPLEAVDRGQLLLLDAEETLEKFMVDGMPDSARFRRTVGPVISRQRRNFPTARLRAYGEMVDILWGRGQPAAAVRLEELWNELARNQPFSLLCAYSMNNFDGPEHSRMFDRVCETHSVVAPAEDSVQEGAADQQMREIVHLQQRIRVLERQLRNMAQSNAELLAASPALGSAQQPTLF